MLRCSWLCTLPQVLRQSLLNRLLHHRKCCACSAGKGRQARGVVGAIEAEHGVLDGAESTYARLVPGRRTGIRHVSCDWGAGGIKDLEQITTLRCSCGRRHRKVNHTGVGRSRPSRTAIGRRSQDCQGRSIADGRVSRGVGNLRRIDRTQRADGRRFVSRNARPQQVWNSDRGDDQNDRDPTISNSISEKPFCFRISFVPSSPFKKSCGLSRPNWRYVRHFIGQSRKLPLARFDCVQVLYFQSLPGRNAAFALGPLIDPNADPWQILYRH